MAATVADIMDRDAPFVTLEAGVEEVVEHRRDVGPVTRADVLAALQQEG